MKNMVVKEDRDMVHVAERTLAILREGRGPGKAAVLGLYGELGAGKTTFTKALAEELGVTEEVTSPTFLLLRSYDASDKDFHTLVHIDAYRLESPEELVRLEWGELLAREGQLICVEWADRVEALLPAHTVRLRFEHVAGGRMVTFL